MQSDNSTENEVAALFSLFFLLVVCLSLLIVPTTPLALFFPFAWTLRAQKESTRQRGEKADPKGDDIERTPKDLPKKQEKKSADALPCAQPPPPKGKR